MNNVVSILKFVGVLLLGLLIAFGIAKLAQIIIPGITTTIAALVAFGGTILAVLIKNYLDRASLIESELRKEKQKNYDELISSIGIFIRDPKSRNDDFLTIHLKSWIYGTEEVTKLTKELVEYNRGSDFEKLNDTLEKLLRAMRKDVGLENIDQKFKMINAFISSKKIEDIRGT